MAIIKKVRGFSPIYGEKCWFADNAALLGEVILGNGTVVESQTIYAGVPAKWVKNIAAENREMMVRIAGNYQKYASWFQDELPKKA